MSNNNFLIDMDHISDVQNNSIDYYEDALHTAEIWINDSPSKVILLNISLILLIKSFKINLKENIKCLNYLLIIFFKLFFKKMKRKMKKWLYGMIKILKIVHFYRIIIHLKKFN